MSRHKLEYKDFVDATGDLVAPSFGYWFAGFTDGEGCFQIHQKNAPNPSWCCTFAIALRADDIDVLDGIERWLTIGSLISSEARSGNMNPSVKFHVGDKNGCQLLVDIFTRFPLQTKKRNDFEIWSKAVQLWSNGPSPKKHWSKHTTPTQLETYHVSMMGFRNDLRKGREYHEPS